MTDQRTYTVPRESCLHEEPVRGVFERLTGGSIEPEQTLRGGKLARQAAMLCRDQEFQLYLDRRSRYKHQIPEPLLPDGTHNEQDARDWLCAACKIESRAQLDHNPKAASAFKDINHRFGKWRWRRHTEKH